jgi:putative tryptophan/tyrosine transport system substrate-binding protein
VTNRTPHTCHRATALSRVFTALASASLLVVSLAMTACAWAQQPARLPKIGILLVGGRADAVCEANGQKTGSGCFLAGLRALGYVDGRNVVFEYRFAEGDYKRLPALAAELVSLQPDVIYTHSRPGAEAAASATTTVPIVVGPAGEEALTRLAGNLARPTGNLTGITLESFEQDRKCLEILKELVPRMSRVAVLFNPDNPTYQDFPGILAAAAAQLGLTLSKVEARNVAELARAFATIASSGVDAIFMVDDGVLASTQAARKQVSEFALGRRLPLGSSNSRIASDGGLVSFGTDIAALGARAAFYVDKILKGAKASDLPVERPTTFKLSVNLKTAKALRLTIPQSMLVRADEVLQ